MNREYKSIEYLKELKYNLCIENNSLSDILDIIGYILTDNGYTDARYFLDDLSDDIYNDNIDILEEA